MNAVERAIAAISPRWAAERAYFRTVLEIDQARSYNAAKSGRRTDGWYAGGGSANAELGLAVAKIRNRARDLVRNNPYAAGYPGMMASKIVGSGIQPRLAMMGEENKAARAKARGIWDRFADNCDPERLTDFYGLQSLAARTVAESGEAIVRTIRLPASAKAAFPLKIVVQEGDYIDSTKTLALDGGNVAIQGIEFNSRGERVAYWLFDEHPGGTFVHFSKNMMVSRRVDAVDIDHIFDRLRPGQVRGVSPFAAVAMKMRDLDDYDDAELMRKKIAACFAAFVKRPTSVTSPLTGASTTDAQGKRIERMNPGMINYLEQGEEVSFADPPSADAYTDYHFGQLYAVAAGLGCTFEQLTGNLKGVNLSSIRVGENRFRDLLDHLHWHMYVPQMCKPSWARVGQVARITGELALSDPWKARWMPPAWRSPDPQTDVDSTRDAVRSLQVGPLDAIARGGYDPDEVLEETANFNALVDKLGIVTDMDPRKVGRASAAAPAQVAAKPAAPES